MPRRPAFLTSIFLFAFGAVALYAAPVSAEPVRFVPAATPTATPVPLNDWPTYQYDVRHDGYNPNSAAISVANAPKLHLAWVSASYDFNTGNQPILATNVGTHKGIIVYGGGTGNLYAVDALSGAYIWHRPLGTTHFECGGDAQYGVGGTAVYDPNAHVLYAASTSNAGENLPTKVILYKINPLNGAIIQARVVNVNLAGQLDFTHAGVTLSPSGVLYVGTGSSCDLPWWRGSVTAVQASTFRILSTFYTVYDRTDQPNPGKYSGGGVWGWGGVSIDNAGNVYFGVGNADINPGSGGTAPAFTQSPAEYVAYGDHIVKTTANLATVLASNLPVPPPTYTGSAQDLDFSGTPVIAYPLTCTQRAAATGKAGGFYIYNAGAIGAGPLAHFQFGPPADYASSFATPAYSPLTGLYYTAISSSMVSHPLYSPGMAAISPCTLDLVWHARFGPDAYGPYSGGEPRSAPTVTAGGVVLMGTPCSPDTVGSCGGTDANNIGGALWMLDATTGTVINNGLPLVRMPNDIRMAPVVDGDWVYVLDNGGFLYGFTTDPNYKTVKPPSGIRPERRSIVHWR